MAKPTTLLLILLALTALPGPAGAQDRHGVTFSRPVYPADLERQRPRGLFYTETDNTLDYNSYSYDDRYHGPAPYYGTRPAAPPLFFAPGYPLVRYSAGGALRYWPR